VNETETLKRVSSGQCVEILFPLDWAPRAHPPVNPDDPEWIRLQALMN
jgi:hypothetical protein